MQRYSDEIGYIADKNKNRVCSYAKSPEDVLLENECREEIEEWEERQELIKRRMREIFWEKYSEVLTKVEKFYLQKLLFEIDNYYPDDENQYAAAAKMGVTREYFGLIIHRLYKKILENPDIKRKCFKKFKRRIRYEHERLQKKFG